MQKYQMLYKFLTPTFFVPCLQSRFGEISCDPPDNKNGNYIFKMYFYGIVFVYVIISHYSNYKNL
jgi:hypothetical protein